MKEQKPGSMVMTTYKGINYSPTSPTPETIDLDDIAHALSQICRFAGHCWTFYSVAQHSVIVANIVKNLGGDTRAQLHGLLHDATEAYLTDIPTPVKVLISGYKELEDKFYECVAAKFGLDPSLPDIVHTADGMALAAEARDLMGNPDWGLPFLPAAMEIMPVSSDIAKAMFYTKYRELTDGLKIQP